MNKRYLRSLIANIVSATVGIPNKADLHHEWGLDAQQCDDVITIYNDVLDKRDLFFKDNTEEYNLHVVRQFILRKCSKGTTGKPYLLVGEAKLEEFILLIHKELVCDVDN